MTSRSAISGLIPAVLVLLLVNCVTRDNSNPLSIVPLGSSNATTGSICVVNNSSYTIYYLYISPSSDTSWGTDQLGSSEIAPGTSFTFTDITPGTYDLRAQNPDKTLSATYMYGSLSAGQTITWTVNTSDFTSSSSTASLVVQNNSSYTIYYLNVSLSSDTSWGNDQLGTSTIAPGASYTVNEIPEGIYDLRAQTSGKAMTATFMNTSFSAGGSYTWTLTTSDFSATTAKILMKANQKASAVTARRKGWLGKEMPGKGSAYLMR